MNNLEKEIIRLNAELNKGKFDLLDKLDLGDYFIVSKAEKELSNKNEIKI